MRRQGPPAISRASPEVPAFAGTTFKAALERLNCEGPLGVAVSGGPDSLALLLFAARAKPGEVLAATVDHGLRAESAAEAEMVAGLCAGIGVPHEILSISVEPGASVQAQARTARYEALGEWAERRELAAIATGHHADDQAETLLMRLERGSGVGGLRGIREERPLRGRARLIRPLLTFRKAELLAVVEAAGWPAIDDPANHDERHDRTRVRALLAATPWLDPERLGRSARALGEADDALGAQLRSIADKHLEPDSTGAWIRGAEAVPREIRRRLLLNALELVATRPSGPELDRVLAALDERRTVTIGAAMVTPRQEGWRVEPAPPRRSVRPTP